MTENPTPTDLLPRLRAEPEIAADVLAEVPDAEVPALFREVCGARAVSAEADPQRMRTRILHVLEAERSLHPVEAPGLGEVVHDEDSGEDVEVTREWQQQVHQLSADLMQAEYLVGRGLSEICRALAGFRDARGYLLYGYRSFAAYCRAGQLRVLGKVRSRQWAYERIQIWERLGPEVVRGGGQLSFTQLRKLSGLLTEEAGDAALEADAGQLVYTDTEGARHTLALPQSPDEARRFSAVLEDIVANHKAARRAAEEARGELAAQRQAWAEERRTYEDELQRLRDAAPERERRTAEVEEALASEELTPQQAQTLREELTELRQEARRLRQAEQDAETRAREAHEQLDTYRRRATELTSHAEVEAACNRYRDAFAAALCELEPLTQGAANLTRLSRQALLDALLDTGSRIEQLKDRCDADTLEEAGL